jgi:Na+-translocating ferredoxin:NAD+ oxidoreductase subunit B
MNLTDKRPELNDLIQAIDACLPQTQCMQCGYNGCRPYAEAVARGEADINQCPPGGEVTINALATLLQVETKPLNPKYGLHKPRTVAWIEEALCIGCTLCIKACPVDAILGATKQMHTVLTQECTGCELCVAPCPVDCIHMRPVTTKNAGPWPDYSQAEAEHARRRTQARMNRLQRKKEEPKAHVAGNPSHINKANKDSRAKKAEIRAAVARVKAKRQAIE